MKNLILLCLLLVMPVATAQETPAGSNRVMPLSGRYSFEIPDDWIASTLPVDDTQGLFPTEALTIAPPPSAFSGEFEVIGAADFSGEGIVSAVWPAGLLDALEMDAQAFGQQIVSEAGDSVERVPFDAGEANGTLYKLEQDNGAHLRVITLEDEQGNMLLVIAFADAEHIAEIDLILQTLKYIELEADATITVEILEGTAMVQIPATWWFAVSGETRMIVSDFTAETFSAFQEGSFDTIEGVFMIAFEREKSLFPDDAYDDDGKLKPEVVIEQFNLAGLMRDFEGEVTAETWQNDGIAIQMTSDEGLRGEIVIVDAGEKLLALVVVANEDSWEQYSNAIDDLLESVELMP